MFDPVFTVAVTCHASHRRRTPLVTLAGSGAIALDSCKTVTLDVDGHHR